MRHTCVHELLVEVLELFRNRPVGPRTTGRVPWEPQTAVDVDGVNVEVQTGLEQRVRSAEDTCDGQDEKDDV